MKSNKHTPLFQAIQNQEKWRQRQIIILYGSGRPIFQNWKQKVEYPILPQHLLKYYNPIIHPNLK